MNQFLVVEDDPTTVKILGHLLNKVVPDRFVVAPTLAVTQTLLDNPAFRFAGALVDIELPDAPGGEAVDLLLDRNIPCVVLTSRKDHSMREEMLAKGVADFINKGGRHWYYYAVEVLRRFELNQQVTALVACGDDAVAERFCHMLHSFRFPILDTRTSRETLKILKTRPDVQLLVVDMALIDTSGLLLVQTIRHQYPDRPLGIIGISNQDESLNGLGSAFIKSGADDFLWKPVDQEEFHARVMKRIISTEHLLTLKAQANKDYLTGLFNRRYFAQEADKTLKRLGDIESCVGMMDIDHFKRVNDEYGHHAGDIVLKRLADELLAHFPDALISRHGGEEFSILMAGQSGEEAYTRMDRFRQHIESISIDVEDGDFLRITLCAGLCAFNDLPISQSLSVADECLYRAKIGGRNQVIMEKESSRSDQAL